MIGRRALSTLNHTVLLALSVSGLSGYLLRAQSSQTLINPSFEAAQRVPRVALVVGAEHYWSLPPVPNALHDAEIMSASLSSLGFSVRTVLDPTTGEIADYVRELVSLAGDEHDPAIIVFFFAGHGYQNGQWNGIVPVNAPSNDPISVSIPVTNLITDLSGRDAGVALLFFDSCRTGGVSNAGGRDSPSTQIQIGALPSTARIFVGLSAKYGFPSFSGVSEHDPSSPFSIELSRFIVTQGVPFPLVYGKIQNSVQWDTHDAQSPDVVSGGDFGGFYFGATTEIRVMELSKWRDVLKSPRSECVHKYVNSHPDSPYLRSALRWLTSGSRNSEEVTTPCPDDSFR
jgi:hypothetical protein